MYRFYESAAICFAYLRDVSVEDFDESFVKSEWFTRGWTLQELLASTNLEFYDCNWNFLGNKRSLSHLISAATGIQTDVLLRQRPLRECSVAERMSWAARRVTTRIEDRAYSLLGIFDVNMTMLYGEGSKSFLRLQEEILKSLDDHSIFVWKGLQPRLPGLLASSPEDFASSGDVIIIRDRNTVGPYSMNSRGVHGLVRMYPYTLDTYLMVLPCARRHPDKKNARIGIFLRRLFEDDQFMRVVVNGEELMEDALMWEHGSELRNNRTCLERNISIRQRPLLLGKMADAYTRRLQGSRTRDDAYIKRVQGFRLNESLWKGGDNRAPPSIIHGTWNPRTRIVSLPLGAPYIDCVGSIDIGPQEREIEMVKFGFDDDYNPVVYLTQKDVQCSEASWSQYRHLPDGRWLARVSADVDGCWALKADRVKGLDVHLVKLDRKPQEANRFHLVGRVQARRKIVDDLLVWDLQVDELTPRGIFGRSFLDYEVGSDVSVSRLINLPDGII